MVSISSCCDTIGNDDDDDDDSILLPVSITVLIWWITDDSDRSCISTITMASGTKHPATVTDTMRWRRRRWTLLLLLLLPVLLLLLLLLSLLLTVVPLEDIASPYASAYLLYHIVYPFYQVPLFQSLDTGARLSYRYPGGTVIPVRHVFRTRHSSMLPQAHSNKKRWNMDVDRQHHWQIQWKPTKSKNK